MPENNGSYTIEASPTKELFIYMLTRDIPLIRAILDLVDNSVDGATRMTHGDDYSMHWVRIECTKKRFAISDNCGGIPVDVARDYAFRFGRPKKTALTPGSIGKFGVGMKRSFFKLGNFFRVESHTSNSNFVVEHNVSEWLQEPDNWHFKFIEKNEDIEDVPGDSIGTKITVSELFPSVSENFGLENFTNQLCNEIEMAHAVAMEKGLAISFNGRPLGHKTLDLLQSDQLHPAFFEEVYQNFGPSAVNVKIYTGISERDIEKGGWYIFCNGRMVLEADQSSITTWGIRNNMPKYHPIYAYFRGYVFFDSEDAELLPWTTTKTGIDSDSALYKLVKLSMINLKKPVLDFLRKLDNERSQFDRGEIETTPLEGSRNNAAPVSYQTLQNKGNFVFPKVATVNVGPRTGRIQYNRPLEDIIKLKKILKVSSHKAVGEETFDYFVKMECEE